MSSVLPLKIRIGIRDTWNPKDKALQLAVRDLAKILGHRIEPETEWPALWNSTKTSFPDSSTFVPSIAQIAVTWYRQLATRIEQDDQSKWIEELLENLKQAPSENSNTLWVQPSAPTTTNVVRSRWDKDSKKFYMEIPEKMNPQMLGIDYDFDRDFDGYFSEVPVPGAGEHSGPEFVTGEPHIEDEWADIVVGTRVSSGQSIAAPRVKPIRKPMRIPLVEATARPSDLLKNLASHYLIFNANIFPAWIQCSHEPTLNFLAEYLKKHGKTNVNDSERRPVYKVELRESSFCHGLRDSMIIDSYLNFNYRGEYTINPTLILALIEGVLGYTKVDDGSNYWIFRHETGFA